jgi:hypothetical protein
MVTTTHPRAARARTSTVPPCGAAHHRQRRDVVVDAQGGPGPVQRGASHLHRAEQHARQIDALGRAIAPASREVLQARDRRRRFVDHLAQSLQAALVGVEARIGAQGGDAQGDHVQRVVQVVRQPGSDHAHRVHALLVQPRFPVAQPVGFAAGLLGDVVAERDGRGAGRGGDALEPQLQRAVAAFETAGARRLAPAQQLARFGRGEMPQGLVAQLGMRADGPAPLALALVQLAEERVGQGQAAAAHQRDRAVRAATQPAQEADLVLCCAPPPALHDRLLDERRAGLHADRSRTVGA